MIALISFTLFVFSRNFKDQLRASVFDGLTDDKGVPFGLCLEEGSPEDPRCYYQLELLHDPLRIPCDREEWADDTRCISQAEAGTAVGKAGISDTGLTHTDNFGVLIVKYVNFVLPYLALAAFLAFVVAGFFYVTAFGNEEQLTKSKKIMIFAAAGLIIVISSFAIVQFLAAKLVESLPTPPAP